MTKPYKPSSNRPMRGSRKQSNLFLASAHLVRSAIEMRRQGKSYEAIAKTFGLSASFIWKVLKEHGEAPPAAPSCSSICLPDSYYIVRYYKAGLSADAIANQLGYDAQAIRSLLHRMEIMRDTRPYQRLLDHNWLNTIDTECKAYFLGLLAADGWLSKNSICIALKQSDAYILEQLRDIICPELPIPVYPASYKGAEDQARLVITSKQMISATRELGITDAKSLTMPNITPRIPIEVRHHFVRGYFDGDGSICHTIYRGKRIVKISIRGTKEFLQGLHTATGLPVGGIYPKTGAGIKSLSISGKCRMYQLLDYLYRDATLFLERKKNRFVW